MPITWKSTDMTMGFCLSCHRHLEAALRPLNMVEKMDWTTPTDPHIGESLARERDIQQDHLTDCSACHR
jgi:hypothetical protein